MLPILVRAIFFKFLLVESNRPLALGTILEGKNPKNRPVITAPSQKCGFEI